MIFDFQTDPFTGAARDTGMKSAFTWSTTGFAINLLERVLDLKIQVKGLENLPSAPTLYVVNHFTRIETFIIPYLLYKNRQDAPRSLAHHSLFEGNLGRYISRLGAVSTNEPLRNRLIIGDLMTGRKNWVIYPEGIMVKSKKFIDQNGKFLIDLPNRSASPRTGAAMLALKAALYRQDYLKAVEANDFARQSYYQSRYNFSDPEQVSQQGICIVPVNITYYPIRPQENMVSKLAGSLFKDLPENLEEELKIEGPILLGKTDMRVTFNAPIDVMSHSLPKGWFRRIIGRFMNVDQRMNYAIDRCRVPLTYRFMKSIYTRVTVNFDHLYCKGLALLQSDIIEKQDFLNALCLTANDLLEAESIDLHPNVGAACLPIATNRPFEPLDSIEQEAIAEGIIKVEGNRYFVNRKRLNETIPFHDVRLRRACKVIANEIDPVTVCTHSLERNLALDPLSRRRAVALQLERGEHVSFNQEYARSFDSGISKPPSVGAPYHLKSKTAKAAILLVHGYLAAPMEMRPLGDALHKKGYQIYGVRLKGHGTSPIELEGVHLDDWIQSLSTGYTILKNTFQNVYIVGFSMGATLSIIKAANLGTELDGMALINPALKLRDSRMPLVGPVTTYNEIVLRMRLEKAQFRFVRNDPSNPHINYKLNYLKGMQQLTNACAASESALPDVHCPTLVLQSSEDPIVDPSSAAIIESSIGSSLKKRVMVDSNSHSIITNELKSRVAFEVLEFLRGLNNPTRPDSRSF